MSDSPEIVVGVDGSPSSLHAVKWAAAEAGRRGASLRLVCAYSLPRFATGSIESAYATVSIGAVKEGAEAVLDEAKQIAQDAGVAATGELRVGDAAGVLVEESKTAELCVVGTRGRGGFAERLLGTVSSAVPVHAHCPTVVVPYVAPPGEPKGTPPRHAHPVRRIVVGVDGSNASKVALTHAVDEAVRWEADLTAFSSMPVATGASLFAWAPGPVDHTAILNDLEDELDRIITAELDGRDVPESLRVHRHGLDGTASALLVEFSTAVDLLVVGSRGRGGFSGLLLGSTSQAVLHHAVCPVMVVPARLLDEGPHPTAVAGGLA